MEYINWTTEEIRALASFDLQEAIDWWQAHAPKIYRPMIDVEIR